LLVEFASLWLDLPEAWVDVTDDLPPDSPPTLARPDGIGAIQFTVARYATGTVPQFSEANLREMLARQTAAATGLDIQAELVEGLHIVGGTRVLEENALGAWYVSDGFNLAFVTYVGQGSAELVEGEISDTRDIVNSIIFFIE
jgi:hypothetical protein